MTTTPDKTKEQRKHLDMNCVNLSEKSRVSFCDGSFYDDSLLRRLLSRTEHYRLVVHHCRNSSVLSLLSALLAIFRSARVSSFSISVQFKLTVIFAPTTSIKRR